MSIEIVGGYRFPGNSYEIFEKFFGTTNPFADTLENDGRDQFGSIFGDAFGGKGQGVPSAPQDIVITLECTLHEFYNGCLKKIEFDRDQLQFDGKTTRLQHNELNVEVKPGYSEQTVLTFPNLGNEAYAHRASRLLIKFRQAPHSNYRRNGNDLIYVHQITLEQALLSEPVQIVNILSLIR